MSQFLFWNLLAKKLSGEASPEELEQLELLVRQHPELAYEAERIQQLWQFKKDTDQRESELAFEEHVLKMKEAGISFPDPEIPETYQTNYNHRRRIFNYSIAAILIFLIVGFLWLSGNKKNSPLISDNTIRQVSSPVGSKTKLVLPDSTIVWMNAGSKLTYNEHFGTTNRNITLAGEAFFDVKKTAIPFIIHANTIQIKVLGTAFNVRSYDNEIETETALVHGSVEVTLRNRPDQKIFLKPGEKLLVKNIPVDTSLKSKKVKRNEDSPIAVLTNMHYYGADSSSVETSWTKNQLVFNDESLDKIALNLERWFNVRVTIVNESLKKEKFTATIEEDDKLEEVLEALKLIEGFHYSVKDKEVIISR